MSARRRPRGIVPPDMLDRIAQSSDDPSARASAARTLALSDMLRRRRETGPVEPQHGEDRTVYDAGHTSDLDRTLRRREDDPPTGDTEVDQAYDGAGATFGLYLTEFGRHSLDDAGLPLVSTVHYEKDFSNAFWDGRQMVYGDGDGRYFYPFTRSIDVIGHELTHGVVQYTCNLVYQGQPGALNEHLADVFGVCVRQVALGLSVETASAWLIGPDLFRPGVQARGLRDMLHPGTAYDDPTLGRDPQPAHMDDYVSTREDNGGVHINSGIPNRAFALAARGIGRGPALQAWYGAMKAAGWRTAFPAFAGLTVAHALTEGDRTFVKASWSTVGVTPADTPAPDPAPDPAPTSPCEGELRALLGDERARAALATLASHPLVRRLLARARKIAGAP